MSYPLLYVSHEGYLCSLDGNVSELHVADGLWRSVRLRLSAHSCW